MIEYISREDFCFKIISSSKLAGNKNNHDAKINKRKTILKFAIYKFYLHNNIYESRINVPKTKATEKSNKSLYN